MCRKATNQYATLCLIALVAAEPSFASEIFHWVDEDGVLNFSDCAPDNDTVDVSKLIVSDSNPSGYDPIEDQNSILEQAARINERWTEMQQRQDERRQQRQQLEERQRSRQVVEYDYSYYNSPYFHHRPIRQPVIGQRPPFQVQKRQFVALDQLGLTGSRPHSINSSAHLARINANKSFNGSVRMQHRSTVNMRPRNSDAVD